MSNYYWPVVTFLQLDSTNGQPVVSSRGSGPGESTVLSLVVGPKCGQLFGTIFWPPHSARETTEDIHEQGHEETRHTWVYEAAAKISFMNPME